MNFITWIIQIWFNFLFCGIWCHIISQLINVVEFPKDVFIEEGNTAVIPCSFQYPLRGCSWSRNGRFVSPLGDRYTYSARFTAKGFQKCDIVIQNVSSSLDGGQWKCATIGDRNYPVQELPPVNLYVVVQPEDPTIVFDDEEITDELSNPSLNGELVCISRRGNPAAQLHWELDGKSIPEGSQFRIERHGNDSSLFDSMLHLDMLTNKEALEYAKELKCVADHPTYNGLLREVALMDNSVNEELSNGKPRLQVVGNAEFWFFAIVIATVIIAVVMLIIIALHFYSDRKRESMLRTKKEETIPEAVEMLQYDMVDGDMPLPPPSPQPDCPPSPEFPPPPPPLPPSPSLKPNIKKPDSA